MSSRRSVGIWLMAVALLIGVMIAVGGLTRLTGSGLSITEWKPVTGALPPLSAQAWDQEFDLYKRIPQYKLLNSDMTLSEFKSIYWWEWSHRFLGRFIGLAFLLPFLWFAAKGGITRKDMPRMILLFVLGGMQGAVGWWMVASGLEERVTVSHYRLAIHLGIAFILLGAIIWVALDYLRPKKETRNPTAGPLCLVGLIYAQVVLGAMVAGLHAGLLYNSWPLMDGRVFPEGAFSMSPWWMNFFENAGLVQFMHRIGAYLVALSVFILWWRGRGQVRHVLLALTAGQVVLGVITLLHQAPLLLSALHQTVAAALFATAVWYAYDIRHSMPDRDRR